MYKVVGGSGTILQSVTHAPAIARGGAWNTLKVTANGPSLAFAINGTTVWTGNDSGLATGRAGIMMHRDDAGGNQLWVDYARLTPIDQAAASALADPGTVSLEQKARNEAANREARDRPANQRGIPDVPSSSASPIPRGR